MIIQMFTARLSICDLTISATQQSKVKCVHWTHQIQKLKKDDLLKFVIWCHVWRLLSMHTNSHLHKYKCYAVAPILMRLATFCFISFVFTCISFTFISFTSSIFVVCTLHTHKHILSLHTRSAPGILFFRIELVWASMHTAGCAKQWYAMCVMSYNTINYICRTFDDYTK